MGEYEEIVGKICGVDVTDGTKSDGTHWDRASIKIDLGDTYPTTVATFDTELIDFANKYNGKKIRAKFKKSGKYNNLIKEGLEIFGEDGKTLEVKEEGVKEEPTSTKTPESIEKVKKYQERLNGQAFGMLFNNTIAILIANGEDIPKHFDMVFDGLKKIHDIKRKELDVRER